MLYHVFLCIYYNINFFWPLAETYCPAFHNILLFHLMLLLSQYSIKVSWCRFVVVALQIAVLMMKIDSHLKRAEKSQWQGFLSRRLPPFIFPEKSILRSIECSSKPLVFNWSPVILSYYVLLCKLCLLGWFLLYKQPLPLLHWAWKLFLQMTIYSFLNLWVIKQFYFLYSQYFMCKRNEHILLQYFLQFLLVHFFQKYNLLYFSQKEGLIHKDEDIHTD